MTYSVIGELTESRMFPSRKSLEKEDFTSLTEGTYFLLIILRILMTEDVSYAVSYVRKAISTPTFRSWRGDANDLYLHCYGLTTGSYEAEDGTPETISMVTVLRWLKEMVRTKGLAEGETNRFFLRIDRLFYIEDSSMRAIRRLVMDWPDLGDDEKRLVCTRLLQMLRSRMPKCDLLPVIQKHIRDNSWEIKGACDKESGQGCGEERDGKTSAQSKKTQNGHGLLTGAALAAAGFAAGYAATRRRMKESDGGTSSANVAAVVKPLGGDALGPGFGGTHKGIYDKSSRSDAVTVLRRSAPSTLVAEQPQYPSQWSARQVTDHRGIPSWTVSRMTSLKEGEIMRVPFDTSKDAHDYADGLNEGKIVDVRYSRFTR